MRMPKLMSGWVTTDKQVHETREAATLHEIRRLMVEVLRDEHCRSTRLYGLSPEQSADIILSHFDVQPKIVEADPPPAPTKRR